MLVFVLLLQSKNGTLYKSISKGQLLKKLLLSLRIIYFLCFLCLIASFIICTVFIQSGWSHGSRNPQLVSQVPLRAMAGKEEPILLQSYISWSALKV